MKVRIRYNSLCKALVLDDASGSGVTLGELLFLVTEEFSDLQRESIFLSLNKKDPLEGEDKLLKDFGVVSGDQIYVVNLTEPPAANDSQAVKAGTSSKEHESHTKNYHQQPSQDTHLMESESSDVRHNKRNENVNTPNTDINEPCCSSVLGSTESDNIAQSSISHSEEEHVDPLIVRRCLNEPMLCRECIEGQVTALLSEVFSTAECHSSQEVLCVALHVLMVEVGYLPFIENAASNDDRVASPHLIYTGWRQRAPACFTLKFTHSLTPSGEAVFCLTCVPMGHLMVIHGQLKEGDIEEKCQLQLKTPEYVKHVGPDAHESYQSLPKLSRIFKDAIAHPLFQGYREAKSLVPLHGFLALSHEIKLKILGYLDSVSALRMSETCKAVHNISRDGYIWRRIYLRNFGNRQNNSLAQDWYKLYRLEYKNRKERQKWMNQITMVVPPFIPSNPYASRIPPPVAPFHPGIIGGDYDLHPQFHGVPNPMFGRSGQGGLPINPGMRPRIDPFGPLPGSNFRPGRGGGMRDNRGVYGRGGFGGPKFF